MENVLNFISATKDKLLDIPVEDGNLIFLRDHSSICLDMMGVRKIYTNIERILSSQRSDITMSGFYFCTDTNILWDYSNGSWTQITKDAREEVGITKLDGTISNTIIISELGTGIFSVSGQYKISEKDGVNLTTGRELFVCSNGEVNQINGKSMTKYVINSDKTFTKESYITSADFSNYMTIDSAQEIIEGLIAEGVEDSVISILEQCIATESDIPNIFN